MWPSIFCGRSTLGLQLVAVALQQSQEVVAPGCRSAILFVRSCAFLILSYRQSEQTVGRSVTHSDFSPIVDYLATRSIDVYKTTVHAPNFAPRFSSFTASDLAGSHGSQAIMIGPFKGRGARPWGLLRSESRVPVPIFLRPYDDFVLSSRSRSYSRIS